MQPKRLIVIVLIFVCITHFLYMFVNASLFRKEYEQQNISQLEELGEVVRNEIEYALGFGLPITHLGGMDQFLGSILENTPELAYISVTSGETQLFSATRENKAMKEVIVPIHAEGSKTAEIRLGMGGELRKQTFAMLFDLITIVFAGLIITYEIIRFFSVKLVDVPYRESIRTFNAMVGEMNPYHSITMPVELQGILGWVRRHVQIRLKQIHRTAANLNQVAMTTVTTIFYGRQALLGAVAEQRSALRRLTKTSGGVTRIVDPSQIRPVIFLFFLGANIQSTFLPIFARELLETETFLTGLFSNEILMGLPITCHMATVFLFMLFMGSSAFKRWVPMEYAVGIGTFTTAAGLVLCGLSGSIIQLIAGRMLCGVGFSFIVVYGKQFIVEHASKENRSLHLAGFTAAFSGGLFCSTIIGSILADYFSYQFVFFAATAIVLMIYVFDYMIMADKTSDIQPVRKGKTTGLTQFFRTGITDANLICLFIHGIFTRITFIGFFYFSLPVLLKPDFAYADIGRIMMFYSIPSVLFAGVLNKGIKQIRQSKTSVVGSNIIVGVVLALFFLPMSGPLWVKATAAIVTLLILGVSNSITFPAQAALLLETPTAKALGSQTTVSVYSSFERIGSALGPVFYGFFASAYDITTAIAMGGILCIVGNIIFLIYFNPNPTPNSNPDSTQAPRGEKTS